QADGQQHVGDVRAGGVERTSASRQPGGGEAVALGVVREQVVRRADVIAHGDLQSHHEAEATLHVEPVTGGELGEAAVIAAQDQVDRVLGGGLDEGAALVVEADGDGL